MSTMMNSSTILWNSKNGVQPAVVRRALLECTIHTDCPTFRSTPMMGNIGHMRCYIDRDELKHISVELEEQSRLGSSLSSNGLHCAPMWHCLVRSSHQGRFCGVEPGGSCHSEDRRASLSKDPIAAVSSPSTARHPSPFRKAQTISRPSTAT